MDEFREFFGGPLDGQVHLCRARSLIIPILTKSGVGQLQYTLGENGGMVLVGKDDSPRLRLILHD